MKHTRQRQQHFVKVSFTEEDFVGLNIPDDNDEVLDTSQHEYIPPADMSVFDEYEPLPIEVVSYEIGEISDCDDAIQVPSIDENCRWSHHNPVVTVPNMGQQALAHAVSGGEKSLRNAQLSILEDLKHITRQQSNKASISKEIDLISDEEITDKDVICERGGKSNRHAGTRQYRGMIEIYKPQYQSLTAKTAKTNLSKSIISRIQVNGGRFLKKKDDASQKYFVLSPVETTKKVSQALREKKVLKWTNN
eukprot:CAMPEP_0194201212 /NCGR_PEP_ID=MMETSP0156-20130528/1540_1 /TAXON_ID=33649 /ORGANISM="Thalassionema nitzschioides, Strain L26-B" /LENGTH=248 /DNA_ID=CAMNT_0038926343 /DNA_START=33 /DNA_END=779 /DNA_ORIENTATION=-